MAAESRCLRARGDQRAVGTAGDVAGMITTFPSRAAVERVSCRALAAGELRPERAEAILRMDDVDRVDVYGIDPASSAAAEKIRATARSPRATSAPVRAASTPGARRCLHHRAHLVHRIANHARKLLGTRFDLISCETRSMCRASSSAAASSQCPRSRATPPARVEQQVGDAVHRRTTTTTFGADAARARAQCEMPRRRRRDAAKLEHLGAT